MCYLRHTSIVNHSSYHLNCSLEKAKNSNSEDSDDDKAIPPSSEGDQPGPVPQVLEARNHLQHDSTKRQKEENYEDDKENHLMSSPIKPDILSPNQDMVLTPIQNQTPATAAAANGKNVSPHSSSVTVWDCISSFRRMVADESRATFTFDQDTLRPSSQLLSPTGGV